MESPKWQRPTTVPFPNIWRRFEGKSAHSSGKIYKFLIQDITPDLREDIVNHMLTVFIKEAPMWQNQKLIEDPVAVEECRELWTNVLKNNLGQVCLLDNVKELNDPTLPKIVGCNATLVKQKGVQEEKKELKAEGTKKVLGLVNHAYQSFDAFTHFGVSELLYAFGLSVDPHFRGQGVGLELLKARFDLCRAVNIKLTVTIFSAIASQKLAERAGFETVQEYYYDDWIQNGEIVFKNMPTKSVKLMAARIK